MILRNRTNAFNSLQAPLAISGFLTAIPECGKSGRSRTGRRIPPYVGRDGIQDQILRADWQSAQAAKQPDLGRLFIGGDAACLIEDSNCRTAGVPEDWLRIAERRGPRRLASNCRTAGLPKIGFELQNGRGPRRLASNCKTAGFPKIGFELQRPRPD